MKSNETGMKHSGREYDSLTRNNSLRKLALQVLYLKWQSNFISVLDAGNSQYMDLRNNVCIVCRLLSQTGSIRGASL